VKGSIEIDKERCKGCALCIEFCAKDCISLSEELNLKGYLIAAFDDDKDCNGCRNCALMCPDVAIEVSRS
jgi:2-oxoglutarate ferredoxin oxidoreductase subunit delta